MKSSHQNISDLWSQDSTGFDICRCVINQRRFSFLLGALRFDHVDFRKKRMAVDKLVKIFLDFDPFFE